MSGEHQAFYRWLQDAELPAEQLSEEQIDVLEASFQFLEETGGITTHCGC